MSPNKWNIHRFVEIDSTSSWLKAEQEGLPEFTVAVADFQTAGRGRLGRQWVTPPDSALMFSFLLRPNWPVERAGWFMMITGLAAAQTLTAHSGLSIKLKWPNDVVVEQNGDLHKLGGILQEAEMADGRIDQVIVGIGINVNIDDADLPKATHTPAASLRSLTGRLFDRDLLLKDFLSNFETFYQECATGRSPLNAWEAQLVTLGQRVTATQMGRAQQSEKIWGTAVGVDEWGRLLIQTDADEPIAVAAADVTLRKE